jgi:hypothetical protein
MTTLRAIRVMVVTACVGLALSGPADALELITNGGFELGFSGWTRADEVGSEGTFFVQTGAISPVNALTVPPPPEATTAAMTDAQGPGSHVLYQDFVLPTAASSANLSFQLFVGNRATEFFTPATLAFATPTLNQQARVDIVLPGADPFTVEPADVLLNAFRTNVGDPLVSGYNPLSVDVTSLVNAHLGETVRLRFAEVDNVFIFNFGVDSVHLTAGPAELPEPASVLLALGAMLVMRKVRSTSLHA